MAKQRNLVGNLAMKHREWIKNCKDHQKKKTFTGMTLAQEHVGSKKSLACKDLMNLIS